MKEIYFKTNFGKMFIKMTDLFNSKTIIWLHGWGMSGETFYSFSKEFKDYNLVFLDMIGFGKSDEPNIAMTLDDYVLILRDLVNSLELKNVILVGHSFGGRVAISYAAKYDVDKVFLVSAKAFKNKSIKYKIKIYKYKFKRNFLKIVNKEKYL